MASTSFLSLSLCFLVLFHGCFAQLEQQLDQQQQFQGLPQQQQHRKRARSECRIQRLTAQEPNRRYEYEAGFMDFWDQKDDEYECAGVRVVRHVIQPRGLLLPAYNSAPQLIYIAEGRGMQGTVFPGCAETYEEGSQSREMGGERSQRFRDSHQKVRRIQIGDVIALPAGITHWAYNDGETPLTCVALIDVGNEANQLDQDFRKFFLAGSSRRGEEVHRRQEEEGRGRREAEGRGRPEHEGRRRKRPTGEQQEFNNMFNGFNEELLADIFNVDTETARRLQGRDDGRGSIVRAERFQVLIPDESERESRRESGEEMGYGGGRPNGIEETFCTMRLRESLALPTDADVYNPHGGRVSNVNSQKLPVLSMMQLSAERGVLYSNAIMAPHWNINAHCAMYVTKGSGRLQVVGDSGRSVFDDEVRQGQLIIVPQNFMVVKKAGNQGLEWVSFKTNDNAMSSQLAGRLSTIRALPEEVLANSYDISREEARDLKYNRDELTVFGPGARSESRSPREVALNVIESIVKNVV